MVLTTLTVQQLTTYLDNLYAALANPTAEVRRPDGTSVRFRSVPEIKEAIAQVEDVVRNIGTQKVSKSTLAEHRRGNGPVPNAFPTDPWEVS
jgi:hypothetical protein